jgi:hypothetical protein
MAAYDNEDGFLSQRKMDGATDVIRAQDMLRRLENVEAERLGVSIDDVRVVVSRQVRISVASLANLRRGRLKGIYSHQLTRIRTALIAALQNRLRALEHEIQLHLQAGADPRDDDLALAQAALAEAKKRLGASVR